MSLLSLGLPQSYYTQDPKAGRGVAFNWAVYRRLLRLSQHRWPSVVALTSAVVTGVVVTLVPPLFFRQIIDHDIPQRHKGLIIEHGLLALAAYVTGLTLSALGNYMASRVSSGVIVDIRTALFDKFQRMPHLFFIRARSGMITNRFVNDVYNAQQLITVTFGTALGTFVAFAFTVGIMAFLSWQVTLFALIAVPAFVIPSFFLSRRVHAATRNQLERFGELTAFLNERLDVSGSLLAKLYGRRETENEMFAERANAVRSGIVRLTFFIQAMTLSTGLMAIGGLIATYIYGSLQVASGLLTLGTMVALSTYILRAATPVLTLSNVRATFLQAQVSLERVFEVLDAPDENQALAPGASCQRVLPSGDIEFSNVSFGYPPASASYIPSLETPAPSATGDGARPLALHEVSFTAAAGTVTALVGPSGAGKSTLCGLLVGLFRPDRGTVRIGGVDLATMTGGDIRATVGMVTQDAYFFHDTIAANLRVARPDATDEQLIEACRQARVHEVVESLPAGYDTLVGERGHRFSGGEKQRLAVARLLLKDPAVVILDEATAHLDTRTEQLVRDALSVALRGRTAVVIAHRLSTIEAADQILVLVGGRIIETGRHRDLLNRHGTYSSLYTTTYKAVSDTPDDTGAPGQLAGAE